VDARVLDASGREQKPHASSWVAVDADPDRPLGDA
jgi:hypothetical protein